VHDLAQIAAARGLPWAIPLLTDLRTLLAAGEQGLELVADLAARTSIAPLPEAELKLLAPYEAGAKILAPVVNYREHGAEANLIPPESPFFFYKSPSSVINPGEPILAHPISSKMDHEVEIAAVIGRIGRDIPPERAYDYVAGYTVLNDVSYRDFQMIEQHPTLARRYGKNWTQGKGFDGACPMGPYLVTRDELPLPYPLEIRCTVNGEVRQHSDTGRMIFKIPELIADISRAMTLYPGDVISTGTCEGGAVGSGRFLRPGDRVECYVARVGTLVNTVSLPD
jgi:2-keto-4-pentenoate hydratase/2-oxohepta-3-ene-1,7-dioic acid hydratase in catechol pathway